MHTQFATCNSLTDVSSLLSARSEKSYFFMLPSSSEPCSDSRLSPASSQIEFSPGTPIYQHPQKQSQQRQRVVPKGGLQPHLKLHPQRRKELDTC